MTKRKKDMKECDVVMRKRAKLVGKLQPADMIVSSFGTSPGPDFFPYTFEF